MTDPKEDETSRLAQRGLSPLQKVRYRFWSWAIRPRALWAQARSLGLALEEDLLPVLLEENQERLVLRVDPAGRIDPVYPSELQLEIRTPLQDLARFLSGLGIRELHVESRLESNQFTDLVTLLYTLRKPLASGLCHQGADLLRSEKGLLFACTRTTLREGVLRVEYTYCMGALSRLLRWFKQTSGHFTDHRALYRVAPRYALLVAVIAGAHLATFWLTDNWWIVLTATLIEAVMLFVLVYMVLMAVGSLEYDNEEKSYRLGRAYRQLQEYAQRIQGDLGRARRVQQQLLPDLSNMPLSDRLQWAAQFHPESEIGGDYFDAHQLDPDRTAVVFCDVSGHGMSAAFVTAIIKTAFQGWIESNEGLVEFAHRLNRRLMRDTPVESFAAVFLGIYDARSRSLCYVNCGHNPEPWIVPADGGELICLDDARGMLMGVIEEGFPLNPQTRTLRPGQTLVMATDGVIEETNPAGELFGRDRLEALLRDLRGCAPDEIVERIFHEIRSFAAQTPQADDCTVLAMRAGADASPTN
jgi:serine phosphatase RsbU (regulator of sigma subunit)